MEAKSKASGSSESLDWTDEIPWVPDRVLSRQARALTALLGRTVRMAMFKEAKKRAKQRRNSGRDNDRRPGN